MNIPTATYRIQFNTAFGFRDAEALVPYLSDLGISHLYASPIFKARKGSPHGYDIIDPNELNPELGTFRDFESLMQTIGRFGMGWIQDIVPNHMAFDPQNKMLMDVLEKGPLSSYYRMFDIDWEAPCGGLGGRVLAPFLGRPYADCLEGGEVKVRLEESGLAMTVQGMRFPLRPDSYGRILGPVLDRLLERADEPGLADFRCLLLSLKTHLDSGVEPICDEDLQRLKQSLWRLYCGDEETRRLIDARLGEVNGQPGKPETLDLLDAILSRQFYRLSYWRAAAEGINYRRFFDINELIGVRVEDGDVFRSTHDLTGRLVARGWVTGLRVDHVDGLYDPTAYLESLRQRFPETYIIVEKILARDESLPHPWPVQGTTGYDFLNAANGLFVKRGNADRLDRLYREFTGVNVPCRELLRKSRLMVLDRMFPGDLDRLSRLAQRAARGSRRGRDFTAGRLRNAIREVLAAFPVYRTYRGTGEIREDDALYIKQTLREACRAAPGYTEEIDFVGLLLDPGAEGHSESSSADPRGNWRMRFQQFCAPLAAKGFEDTLLYVYNRLLSLNEVGGCPDRFGLPAADFHRFCEDRRRHWPHGLNATATHDTKRGEDARARLDVLSEIPGPWTKQLRHWGRINRMKKTMVHGKPAPDRNDEYLFYQALIGACPLGNSTPEFRERMKVYAVKALREAKRHTSWTDPDEGYEAACLWFLDAILTPGTENRFLDGFLRFHEGIVRLGMLNALSQTLIKIAAPGVPDFYQGTELWDLSLVDPDNRRPVDFDERQRNLAAIRKRFDADPDRLISELLRTLEGGRVKMFLIWRGLSARRDHAGLFRDGEVLPLVAAGRYRENTIAFARRSGTAWAVIVAPRLLASMLKKGDLPLGPAVWEDTSIGRLEGMPRVWNDALTGDEKHFDGDFPLGEVLWRFPAALLLGDEGHP
jgi:(1->4)-alpha-D-glucan 1-alpha-D-glucosylmutase